MPDFAPSPAPGAETLAADAPHGGELMAAALREAGVDTLFTLCGGHILPLLDACPARGIRVVDHRHEGAAALAAEGYALATGRAGVAAVTAGAGFANALVGLADAGMWSVPLVLCGGHAPLAQAGRGAVQDAPQLAIAAAVAKRTIAVQETAKIPRFTAEAVYRARAGRPGPVYLELPQDVLAGRAPWPAADLPFGFPSDIPTAAGAPEDLEAALAALERAERPILLVGSGAFWSGAGEAIGRFAELAKIPVTTTSAARGLVPDSHPFCLGTLVHAGGALLAADLVVVLGSAFNANTCFGQPPLFRAGQQLIQVDLAADALGGDRRPDRVIVGDVARVVADLARGFRKESPGRDAWLEQARNVTRFLRATWDQQIEKHSGSRVHAGAAVRELVAFAREACGDAVSFVADGGDALAWSLAYCYAEAPGRLLSTTTALGTLGVGMPFALGARAARPDEPVFLFVGDGAFGFTAMEFESAVRQKLPIVVVVSNNHGWRDVSHEQDMWFGEGRHVATELSDARYDRLAEAFGGHGEHVTRLDELRPALARALESGKAAIVNVQTDPTVLSDLLRNLGSMGIN
ncbi:MAG TPA: thiamine pyrophosphate-binding protein [Myxococcota bacterium]|nr:thiamine pyrophosphate-binding protein [Myxococcota bacterium]